MPLYEYTCSNCVKDFEIRQKISDPKLTKCPFCNQETVSSLISNTSFILKGGGWYATDFKNPSPPKVPNTELKKTSKDTPTTKENKESVT